MKNRLNNNGLKREIGLFPAAILVVANMVGTGIFTASGFKHSCINTYKIFAYALKLNEIVLGNVFLL